MLTVSAGGSDFRVFMAEHLAHREQFRDQISPTIDPILSPKSETTIFVSRHSQADIWPPASVHRKFASEVVIHIIVKRTSECAAGLRMRMNHADSQFTFVERELGSQNVLRIKLYNGAVPLQIAWSRLDRIDKCNVKSPWCNPITEAKKSTPLAVGISFK